MSLIRARYRAVNTIMNLPSGGGFVGLLDLYPNAAAAYSLRLLRKNYSGGLTRVRAWDGVANQGEAEIMPRRIDAQNYVIDLNSKLEDLDATAISRGLTTNDTLADLVLSGLPPALLLTLFASPVYAVLNFLLESAKRALG